MTSIIGIQLKYNYTYIYLYRYTQSENMEKVNDGSLDRECRTCDRGINGYNPFNEGKDYCPVCEIIIDREIK